MCSCVSKIAAALHGPTQQNGMIYVSPIFSRESFNAAGNRLINRDCQGPRTCQLADGHQQLEVIPRFSFKTRCTSPCEAERRRSILMS